MTIQEIIAKEEIFHNSKEIKSEPLNGGLSNETHIVTVENKQYVVKINFPQNKFLSLTRKTEHMAQNKAADMGITSRVFGDIETEEYSITEYIKGRLITNEEVLQEKNLSKIAHMLKQIHSIQGIERTCSVFDLIEGYRKGIHSFNVKTPDGYEDIIRETEKIRKYREQDKSNNNKYCHNDILTCNLLYDEGTIKVIDWELSGMGDPYMDLASLPYSIGLPEEKEKHLLKEYFGYYEDEMLLNLNKIKYVGMVREVMWALFFEGLNLKSANHEMNYHEAACYTLNRIKEGHLSF